MAIRKYLVGAFAAAALSLVIASPAKAAVFLITAESGIAPDGLIDWGVLGGSFTAVPQPFTTAVPGIPGLSVDVSQTGSANFERRDQGNGWAGNFGAGEELLWTQGTNGPMTFDFSNSIQGFGAQIQADFFGPFTAEISAYDALNNLLGTFQVLGNSTSAGDDSAIFIGVLSSSADIARIVLGVPIANFGPQDFAINGPRVQADGITAIPEPGTMMLLGSGIAAVVARARRKSRRQQV